MADQIYIGRVIIFKTGNDKNWTPLKKWKKSKEEMKKNAIKLSIIGLLILVSAGVKAQYDQLIGSGIKCQAVFTRSDSTLTITYALHGGFDKMIWVGDLHIEAIATPADLLKANLASPITHQLLLLNHKTINKITDDFFFRTDTLAEKNMRNYRLIGKDRKVALVFRISDPALLKSIKAGKFKIRGLVTLVDLNNLTNSLLRNKMLTESNKLDLFQEQGANEQISIINNFIFNRSSRFVTSSGLQLGPMPDGCGSEAELTRPIAKQAPVMLNLPLRTFYAFTTQLDYSASIVMRK